MVKQWIFAASAWLMATAAFANNEPIKIKSDIDKVTVFRQNAREHRTAVANIPSGNSELVIEQLSSGILTNSIQVKIGNSAVTLLAAVPRLNYIDQAEANRRYKETQDSLVLMQEKVDRQRIVINALQSRRDVLMQNNPLGSAKDKGFTTEEIEQLMAFRQKELLEIDNKRYDLDKELKKMTDKFSLLQQQLNYYYQGRQKTSGEIVLQLYSTAAANNTQIELSFVVNNAGWVPLYDLRSDGIDKPVTLNYKAYVYQSTGYDWKDVKLVLSTSDPTLSHDRPILDPYYINFAPDYAQDYRRKADESYMKYKDAGNQVLDATGELQYMQQELAPMVNDQIVNNAPITNIYQAYRGSGNNPPNPLTNLDIPTNDNDGLTEFELDINHTIPSDGIRHIVPIKSHELNAVYEYHTVPKLDRGAFLLAKITDYGKYSMLPGDANIFFEGTYLGQSFIDPRITTDTMLLSLGRDERINIKREKMTDLTTKKVLGTHIKETFVYEITIRNNKTRAIDIDILDQIPISQHTDIEVKLEESQNADYRAEYGAMRWKLNIPAGQTQKIRFQYSIRYPKNKTVQYGG